MPVVIKLGGSLLDRVSFGDTLRRYLSRATPQKTWLLVGGGELVEQMRIYDQRFGLDPKFLHWQCIELLETTFELLSQLLPELKRVESKEELLASKESNSQTHYLVSVKSFYQRHELPLVTLPESWATTTDSLAALLALQVNADELVLLKSCEIPPNADLQSLIQLGIVDQAFALIADKLRSYRVERLPASPHRP